MIFVTQNGVNNFPRNFRPSPWIIQFGETVVLFPGPFTTFLAVLSSVTSGCPSVFGEKMDVLPEVKVKRKISVLPETDVERKDVFLRLKWGGGYPFT